MKVVTGNDLQKLWKVGNDSFEKDPPNAVLSSAGQKAQIVILKGMTVTETTVEFPISISEGDFKDPTVTIDGMPLWLVSFLHNEAEAEQEEIMYD